MRLGHFDHLARSGDVDGRAIEQDRAFGGVANHIVPIDRFDDPPVGQHRDDGLGGGAGFLGGAEGRAPRLTRCGERGLAEVEGAHFVASLHKVRSHPAAHVAEADKGDFHVTLP